MKPFTERSMTAANEQHILSMAQKGDKDAFTQLVRLYMKQVYNIAYGFLRDHHHAEDVAQEAFVRIHQSLRSFRGEAEFTTWLYRITANLSLNKKKSVARYQQLSEPVSTITAEDHVDHRSLIERALHELPTLQRAAVILRHINGLSTKQVSTILNCSEGTVKTHVFRGISKLKRILRYLMEDLA
jgi:RNA polymerase sigma-70 factor, ECF subfamily